MNQFVFLFRNFVYVELREVKYAIFSLVMIREKIGEVTNF